MSCLWNCTKNKDIRQILTIPKDKYDFIKPEYADQYVSRFKDIPVKIDKSPSNTRFEVKTQHTINTDESDIELYDYISCISESKIIMCVYNEHIQNIDKLRLCFHSYVRRQTHDAFYIYNMFTNELIRYTFDHNDFISSINMLL